MKLEQLRPNAVACGLLPDALITVVGVQWFGSDALEIDYGTPAGKLDKELLFRNCEVQLDLAGHGRPRSFDGDGALFRPQRIGLDCVFDRCALCEHRKRAAEALPCSLLVQSRPGITRLAREAPQAAVQGTDDLFKVA